MSGIKSQAYMKFFTPDFRKIVPFLLMCCALTFGLNAQITPTSGAIETFQVADGDIFVDPFDADENTGGLGSNYANCGCVTTTTLCASGSAVMVEWTEYDVNESFDWMVILDTDNPANLEFPGSILDDPANLSLQLFNNSDGTGDGGAENYGPGANPGEGALAELTSTMYSATSANPSGCLTFVFRSSTVVNALGWVGNVTTAGNPNCPNPSNFIVADTFATSANFTFNPGDTVGTYFLEIDTAGFAQGMGSIVNTTIDGDEFVVNDLEEGTDYEAYLYLICENGDTSSVLGPIGFTTFLSTDVGVAEIVGPLTGCGLGQEAVQIFIENFGADPQTFITYLFSVNGEPVSIPVPEDGFFTGVIGKDSLFFIEFETLFDFSEPGVYTIAAWTELDGDGDITNDTAYYVFENRPLVDAFPYYEDFEDGVSGWRVGAESVNSSWEFGTPNGEELLSAASGVNAWATNLTGDYNNSEDSYLESTCLDFSALTEDPYITFSFFFDSEANFDEGWLELSLDGGATYEKVGMFGEGLNWYNDETNNWWEGDAGFEGWSYAQHELTGAAGTSDATVRFVLSTDGSVPREGYGIDNVYIGALNNNDLATSALVNSAQGGPCGSEEDFISFDIFNLGTTAANGIGAAYTVNGGPVVTENLPALPLAPGESLTYTFTTPFNSSAVGTYEIVAWTVYPDDFTLNDTTTFTLTFDAMLPLAEDFEAGGLPAGFSTDGTVGFGHNLPSNAIYRNVYSFNNTFFVQTPLVGPISDGDSLTFDYRYVDWSAGTNPTILGGDSLAVSVSTNCGASFDQVFVIDSSNHVPTADYTNIAIDLSAYAGQAVIVRFDATWESGDYWVDLDNINILACPADLDLSSEVTDASSPGDMDGSATVLVGETFGPFDYLWSTGDTTATVAGLAPGDYTVTVTNPIGCEDIISVTVGFVSSTGELSGLNSVRISPNPTTGLATLQVRFEEVKTVRVEIVNSIGQRIESFELGGALEIQRNLDLSGHGAGLYYVRLTDGQGTHTEKLLLAR